MENTRKDLDDDVCPLDTSPTPPRQDEITVGSDSLDPKQQAESNNRNASDASTDLVPSSGTSPDSRASSSASHGPFGDSQAASTSGSVSDTTNTHQRPGHVLKSQRTGSSNVAAIVLPESLQEIKSGDTSKKVK